MTLRRSRKLIRICTFSSMCFILAILHLGPPLSAEDLTASRQLTDTSQVADAEWLSGFMLHQEVNRKVTHLTCGDAEALFAKFELEQLDEEQLPLYYLIREYNLGHTFTFAGISDWHRWRNSLQTLGQRCFEDPDALYISPPLQESLDHHEDTGWQTDFLYHNHSKIQWELEDELYLADFRCEGVIKAIQARDAGDAAARRTVLRTRFYLQGAASALNRPLAEVATSAISWCQGHPSNRLSDIDY